MPFWKVIKIQSLEVTVKNLVSVPTLTHCNRMDSSCNGRHSNRGALQKTVIWINLPGRCCQSCHTWTWWSRMSSPLKEEKKPQIQGTISVQVLSKWFKNGFRKSFTLCPTDPHCAIKLPRSKRAAIWLYNCKVTSRHISSEKGWFTHHSRASVLLLNICDLKRKFKSSDSCGFYQVVQKFQLN